MYYSPDTYTFITRADYFAGYPGHAEITPELEAAADALLAPVNKFLFRAAQAGVPIRRNPVTGTAVSGQQNGGWRPQSCPIGAPRSKHKIARGVDVYDPDRFLAAWALTDEGKAAAEEIGLWFEDVRWTPGWLHCQDIAAGNPPRPEVRFFIPDTSPAKAKYPRPWAEIAQQLHAGG